MKMAFSLLLLFSLGISVAQNEPNAFMGKVHSCKSDTTSFYISIIRAKKIKQYFPDSIFSKYYNVKTHDIVGNQTLFQKDALKNYKLSNSKLVILQTLDNWCINNQFFTSIGSYNSDYPPEAVLYNTNKTKFLVTKFCGSKQDWESLSTYQLYELNIEFLNYVDSLSIDQKNQLFKELKLKAQQLSKSK